MRIIFREASQREVQAEYNNCTNDEIAEKYIEGAPLISEEAVQVR